MTFDKHKRDYLQVDMKMKYKYLNIDEPNDNDAYFADIAMKNSIFVIL